jgi:hypothetical protein
MARETNREWKIMGEERDSFEGKERSSVLLEGSQASPVRPCDKGSVELKKIQLSQVVASDWGRGNCCFFSELKLNCII